MTTIVELFGRQVAVEWCRVCGRHDNKIVAVKGTDLCPWHSLTPAQQEAARYRKQQKRKRKKGRPFR